ncbi:MAG: cupin domain-containing protein [Candidatus Bathyarchaeia archaeon]
MSRKPQVVTRQEADTRTPTFVKATRVDKPMVVRRFITRQRVGSEKLMLGVVRFEAGGGSYTWSFPENDEVYYIIKGSIALEWAEGKLEAKEGDAVFLPAGVTYTVTNATERETEIVYVLTPPIE